MEQDKECISVKMDLEGAAQYHIKYGQPKVKTQYEAKYYAFKAGAQWQKEQSKELIRMASAIIEAYDIRYPNAKQLLIGYTNEESLKKFIDLLTSYNQL